MDDFEKAEGLEFEASRAAAAAAGGYTGTPAGATPAAVLEPGLAFEDGPHVGRFRVTKRAGMTVGPVDQGPAGSHQVKLIVVLFGWLTCQDKHLYKYAEMYHQSIGVEVVLRHTVPTGKVLRRKQRGVVRAAEEMMALVPVYFPNAKVVVQYFSNGGCFVHRRLLHLLNGHYDRHPHHFYDGKGPKGTYTFPQLAATIFDSCPAHADASTGAKAVSAALRGPLARILVYTTVRFGLEVYGLAQFWRFERKYVADMSRHDHLLIPSLYIYSDDDVITDAALVENVVASRKAFFTAQGLPADAMIETWKVPEPSSHVCHYARHPAAYKQRLQEFLRTQGLVVA